MRVVCVRIGYRVLFRFADEPWMLGSWPIPADSFRLVHAFRASPDRR